jgi:methylmalonyl-CoA mutase
MNHFMEIAKMRAGRMIWAKLVKQFNPTDAKSLALRTHCQTTGNRAVPNVARTCIEASAAALGNSLLPMHWTKQSPYLLTSRI